MSCLDLLGLIKNYLNITWEDTETDKKIQNIIELGKSYLNNVVSRELDYSSGKPLELLIAYCRYSFNESLEDFSKNFQHELICLQIMAVSEIGE